MGPCKISRTCVNFILEGSLIYLSFILVGKIKKFNLTKFFIRAIRPAVEIQNKASLLSGTRWTVWCSRTKTRDRALPAVSSPRKLRSFLPYIRVLDAFVKLRKTTVSFILSVHPSVWNNSAPTRRIFKKFCISLFFENPSRKFKFH